VVEKMVVVALNPVAQELEGGVIVGYGGRLPLGALNGTDPVEGAIPDEGGAVPDGKTVLLKLPDRGPLGALNGTDEVDSVPAGGVGVVPEE
jgi:hypothetical protein